MICYIDKDSGKVVVREDFLAFIEGKATTGEAIAELLLSFLHQVGLDPNLI